MTFAEESTTTTPPRASSQTAPAPGERRDDGPSERPPEPALDDPDPMDDDEGYGHGV